MRIPCGRWDVVRRVMDSGAGERAVSISNRRELKERVVNFNQMDGSSTYVLF